MPNESLNLFDEDSQNTESIKTEPQFVVGKVSAIFFASPDSFYKVLLVKISETNLEWHEDEIVVTGSFGDIKEEQAYRFVGATVTHPKYGTQFQATNYESATPTTKEGLVAYLSGDEFKGIGKKTAEKIVALLGTGAIDKIIQDPDVLTPLNFKKEMQANLVAVLKANNGMEQIIIGLNGYGFGSQLAASIYNKYREETLDILHKNPYQLIEDIDGIGFKRADQIAEALDISFDAPARIDGAILTASSDISNSNGDTYTDARSLLKTTLGLLENSRNQAVDPQKVADELVSLAKDGKVVGEENRIYLRNLFEAEWQIAEHVKRLHDAKETHTFETDEIQGAIDLAQKQFHITYDDSQRQALLKAMQSKLFLLTGGPGTGKTTIINGIVKTFATLNDFSLDVNEYHDNPFPVLLAAPTGRAAKRMSEVTGLPASTIHRMLGLTGRETNPDQETKDLEGSLLIVDEMSMVDTFLFKTLMRAISNNMKVILVGDKDQLPSVGAGQIFNDLLKSEVIPKIELTKIYRQDNGSSIVPLAHAIKEGRLPDDFTKNQKDRSFIACSTSQVDSVISQVVHKAEQKGFTAQDIQVLAPMYRGMAGIDRLNESLQKILNPKKNARTKEVEFRGQHFRIGDKVLQLVNVPENNVFNGDMGIIKGIISAKDKDNTDKQDKLVIDFDETEVTYGRKDWIQITLAYCTSIHKSQGSEFKMVILPMVQQYSRMLQRNLLYTAVSRAESLLILLGDKTAFEKCVNNLAVNRRTTLKQRLLTVFDGKQVAKTKSDLLVATKKVVPQVETEIKAPVTAKVEKKSGESAVPDTVLTISKVQGQIIDPMIGMAGITPQSFMKA
ncbi:ATP-dependent RecD-like DNA helicase [Pediococcus parvulus]|uniref:SF1B family DNA helicase RecD2 n=1 Tax=Pediococcus parvulus TaxID=54062 RepID=UPI0021A68068|nr:ATP-dependent RecD-like DNA helicase [Pediococcus parvulus]MCT3034357.1 ATP-dependent RecD-like DNA helicase [Pediococcus parvulus]